MADVPKMETMQSRKLAGSKPANSTQRFLDIAEIRDDVVVMKDGTLRAVLLVSSINFSLKSQDEQAAIMSGYVSFLNSLDAPIQVVIQSRKLNIDDYLNRLKASEQEQGNDLLRAQIADYRQFIAELVELGEIMQKRFFIVVPYNPATNKRKGFFARMSEIISPLAAVRLKDERFRERKKELMIRVDAIRAGLNSMSISSIMLDTQGLIEMYYSSYNPIEAESQRLEDIGKLRIES